MNAPVTFPRVGLIGVMSPADLWRFLAELDRHAERQRDIQDVDGSPFRREQATVRLDQINQQTVAIERELRERFASLFAGVPIAALAERIGA